MRTPRLIRPRLIRPRLIRPRLICSRVLGTRRLIRSRLLGTRRLISLIAVAGLAAPATAAADVSHTVTRGESLTSVAAADGLSVPALAAANGLSPAAELSAGARLAIPPRGAGTTAQATASASLEPAAPAAPAGGYLVRRGDTLTAIAARYGVSVSALAAANGMRVDGVLEAGRTLSVSGVPAPATAADAAPATSELTSAPAPGAPVPGPVGGGVQPTAQTVSAADVGAIAAQEGVSPSLAEAIGYQESGFNNAEVSRSGATGIMQIEPGTWRDLSALGGPALSATSATDNIRGGVELLRSLLAQTGGDPAQAAAAYFQGLASVRRHGLYPSTQRYVRNVLALQGRFGG